jgi:hypothetical protein
MSGLKEAVVTAIAVRLCGLAACGGWLNAKNSISTPMTAADPPRADEGVVVLPENGDDQQVGMDCVRKAVARRGSIPAGKFRAALFPRFEPGNLPTSEAELADLLKDGAAREKIASMGLRYIVVVRGETRTEDHIAGAGGEGFLLMYSKSSSHAFQVWDLARGRSLGSAYAAAEGDFGGGMVFYIPVAKWAATEAAACAEMTRRLAAIFEPDREATATTNAGDALVLLRFAGRDQNGDPLEPFAPDEYRWRLGIAIGDFDKEGVLRWGQVRTLGPVAREQGWFMLALAPGYHYLAFDRGDVESRTKDLTHWRIEVPPGAPVIYGGTFRFSARTEHLWLQGDRIAKIDQAATTVEDESARAVEAARRDLSALPPPVTRLAVRHAGPILPGVPEAKPPQ